MAREWACSEEGYDGYANEYRFDGRGLKVLELSSPEYSTLHWLALLLEHRKIDLRTPVAQAGSEFLRAHYLLDAESFDVIVGHRADDSYFTFARAFLRNDISLEQLTRALHLGDLGQQIVLKLARGGIAGLALEGLHPAVELGEADRVPLGDQLAMFWVSAWVWKELSRLRSKPPEEVRVR